MKRFEAIVVSVGLMVGLVALPMAAQAGSPDCPTARACIYINNNFVGLIGTQVGGSGLSNLSSAYDNLTSSWENKTASNGAWFTLVNGQGSCFAMRAGYEHAQIPFPNYDKLTSWRMNGGC